MNRFISAGGRISLVFIIAILVLAPLTTFAQTASTRATFFGPIVPLACHCDNQTVQGTSQQVSTAPDFGCVLQTLQNLINFAVSIGILFVVFWIAVAGFQLIVSRGNPSKLTEAKSRITNAVLGIVVILAAWLIVDFVMKTLYNQNSVYGPWNAILAGGNQCIVAKNPAVISVQTVANNITSVTPGTTAGSGGAGGSTGTSASANTRGDCTPSGLASDGMDSSIASTMSCLTKTEDTSCALGAKSGTDIGSDGNSVSIGMFQVNISANNLSKYPACTAAVNNQPLNCTSAFAGGAYTAKNHSTHVTNSNLYSTCVQAASNAQCNVQVAQDLYQNHGGSKNWGTAAQQNCGG